MVKRLEAPGGKLSEGQVLLTTDGPIATVTLNQPTRHNAINQSMWTRLTDLFNEFQNDETIRVVVLRGAGERAFSAGADISEFGESRSTAEQARGYNALVAGAMDAAYNLSKPVVAQIHGYCIGGGCELASCCDLRYCDRESLFGIPMVKLGIGMGLDEIERFVQLVGPANASEILQLGRRITAQRALEMGLVNGGARPRRSGEARCRRREGAGGECAVVGEVCQAGDPIGGGECRPRPDRRSGLDGRRAVRYGGCAGRCAGVHGEAGSAICRPVGVGLGVRAGRLTTAGEKPLASRSLRLALRSLRPRYIGGWDAVADF